MYILLSSFEYRIFQLIKEEFYHVTLSLLVAWRALSKACGPRITFISVPNTAREVHPPI